MSATVKRYGCYSPTAWLLGMLIYVTGCTTSNIDTALTPEPLPSAPQTVATGQKIEEATTTTALAPRNTDPLAYPNINVEPVGETEQLSNDDKQLIRAQAQNAQQSVDISDESAAYAARLAKLKLLAQTHAQRTQQQIEGE